MSQHYEEEELVVVRRRKGDHATILDFVSGAAGFEMGLTTPQKPVETGLNGQPPPPGTDPALWKVLTTEERAFFARARAMGPLTYGPGTTRDGHVPAALQGGRIDVKV